MAALFIVVGVVVIVAAVGTLLFSRQLNDAAVRKRPPPAANRAETLRLFRIRASGLLAGGVVFLVYGLAKVSK